MKLWIVSLALLLPFAAGACNTARGIGEDATAAGHAVSDTAKKLTGSKSESDATPAEGSSAAPAPK
jgi:predicted small secreted protein